MRLRLLQHEVRHRGSFLLAQLPSALPAAHALPVRVLWQVDRTRQNHVPELQPWTHRRQASVTLPYTMDYSVIVCWNKGLLALYLTTLVRRRSGCYSCPALRPYQFGPVQCAHARWEGKRHVTSRFLTLCRRLYSVVFVFCGYDRLFRCRVTVWWLAVAAKFYIELTFALPFCMQIYFFYVS